MSRRSTYRSMEIVPPREDWRVTIQKVLHIGDDLNAEYRRQAELYGTVSWFSAASKRRVRQLKNQMEMVTARIRRKIKLRYRSTRFTKDEMHYMVIRRKSYVNKNQELEEAIYHEEVITGMLKALDHKKEALIGLGANYRHQLPEELRLLTDEMRTKYKRKGRS